jgi:hypothetical protein
MTDYDLLKFLLESTERSDRVININMKVKSTRSRYFISVDKKIIIIPVDKKIIILSYMHKYENEIYYTIEHFEKDLNFYIFGNKKGRYFDGFYTQEKNWELLREKRKI